MSESGGFGPAGISDEPIHMFDSIVPKPPDVPLFGRGMDPLGFSGIPGFPGTPGGPPSSYEDPDAPMSKEDAQAFLRRLREQQVYKEEHPSELPPKGAVGEWEALRHASPKPDVVEPAWVHEIPLADKPAKGTVLPMAPPYTPGYGMHHNPSGKAVEWF